jgi:hypothetical protein
MSPGLSGPVDWATDAAARLSGERVDAGRPMTSEPPLLARDVGGRANQPSSDGPLATLEAATSAVRGVIAELMAPENGIGAVRVRLRAELESVLETLATMAEQNQRTTRHNAELEALLDSTREGAEHRERSLMEQQDGVLEALLTEHERQTEALEHELEVQRQHAGALRRELEEKTALAEAVGEQQPVPPRHAPTPRTWPPNDAADQPLEAIELRSPVPRRPSVDRLVADRDHLLASLKLLKRQRDDAQQETLDLVERLAAANSEIDALRALLPSVSAPPVPSSLRAGTTEPPPPEPVVAREQATGALKARLASTQPPPASESARATPATRASNAPTFPPAEAPCPSEDALLRSEGLHAPAFRTVTQSGPAAQFGNPQRPPVAPLGVPGPPASPDGATLHSDAEAPLSDRKPPLKRKPDPTQRPLGTYSLTGPAETESLHPRGRSTRRPAGGRRP